jgi:cell division protein DivIC
MRMRKKAGIATKIVVIVLVVYASVTLINLQARIETVRADKDELQQQVTEKELANAELEYEIQNSTDDDTIADIAREKLGLVYPGEIIFHDNGN